MLLVKESNVAVALEHSSVGPLSVRDSKSISIDYIYSYTNVTLMTIRAPGSGCVCRFSRGFPRRISRIYGVSPGAEVTYEGFRIRHMESYRIELQPSVPDHPHEQQHKFHDGSAQ